MVLSVVLLNEHRNSNFFTLLDLHKIPPRPFWFFWTLHLIGIDYDTSLGIFHEFSWKKGPQFRDDIIKWLPLWPISNPRVNPLADKGSNCIHELDAYGIYLSRWRCFIAIRSFRYHRYTVNVLSAKSTDECLRTKSQDN